MGAPYSDPKLTIQCTFACFNLSDLRAFWQAQKSSIIRVVCLCFFLLRPPTKPGYRYVTMHAQCMHNIFCWGGEVKHSDESVLPVTKKEGKGKGKWTIGPRMKNGRTNLCSFWAQAMFRVDTQTFIYLSPLTNNEVHASWRHNSWFCRGSK